MQLCCSADRYSIMATVLIKRVCISYHDTRDREKRREVLARVHPLQRRKGRETVAVKLFTIHRGSVHTRDWSLLRAVAL